MMRLQKQFPDSFCKEYKLNTASATGDLSMRLMLILNHLRRISRSGTCWKQATTSLTSRQSEELLELALCVREALFKTSSSMVSDSKESDDDDDVFVQPRVLGKKMSNASEVTHVQIICLLFDISLIFYFMFIYIYIYVSILVCPAGVD